MDAGSPCDLRVYAGRVVCPVSGFDAPGSVGVRGDRIFDVLPGGSPQNSTAADARRAPAATGPGAGGCRELHFPEAILLPGLIDLHAHPALAGSMFGVAPDLHLLNRGTTTVLSQGDAGALNCDEYVRTTIERSRTRVLLAINLGACGEAGPEGCFADLSLVDVNACVSAVERIGPHVWGIAVNTSHHCCGRTDPREVLRRGLIAADATGLPLLYGMRRPEDWPLEEQLALLRPGDVVTYCFRRSPHCIVQEGQVLPAVCGARERGVLFDVGHGRGSFDFEVAAAALHAGFAPDSISTDLQRGHLEQQPVHDLPLVMSKLLAAGMPESLVFAAATSQPARILGPERSLGQLTPGAPADLTVLAWRDDGPVLTDVNGQTRPGGHWTPVATIRGGQTAPCSSTGAAAPDSPPGRVAEAK